MESIITTFYKVLSEQILTKAPEVKYIDLFNNQPDMEEEELNYNLPAAFIEFEPIEWQSVGKKVQVATCQFNIFVESETLSETSNLENESEKDYGLYHLTLCDKITKALQGISFNNIGTISRIGFAPDTSGGQTKVSTISFKTRLTDEFNKQEVETINPKPPLDLEF